jgi:signal transduction histidine kinase
MPAVARAKAVRQGVGIARRIVLVETGAADTATLCDSLRGQNLDADLAPDLNQACQMVKDGLHDVVIAGPRLDTRNLQILATIRSSSHAELHELLSKLRAVSSGAGVKAYLSSLAETAAIVTGAAQTFALLCDRATGEPDLASLCTRYSDELADFLRRCFAPSRTTANAGSPVTPDAHSRDGVVWLIPLIHDSQIQGMLGFRSQTTADQPGFKSLGKLQVLAPVSAALIAVLRDADGLRRTADEFEAIVQINSHLMSNVCHEFRSMLAAVRGYSKRIMEGRDGEITDAQRDGLTVVLRNTNKLLYLVSHSLPFVAEQRLRVESIDLREIWLSALQRVRLRLTEKSITIKEQIPLEPLTVAADRQRLATVFEVILANAIQCAGNGAEIVAELAHGANGEVTVRILAGGEAIPAEWMEKSFDHLDEPALSESGPHGMRLAGLSLVHDMVWLHGGRMAVMSTAGKGTVFVVTLPSAG